MPLFKRDSEIAIMSASGMLRVTVKPRFHPLVFIVEGAALAGFIFFGWKQGWALHGQPSFLFSLLALGIGTSIWHQLSGSEEIEFNGQTQTLVVRRSVLGWPRTTELAFNDLSALEPRYARENEGNSDGLRCKAGDRTITFGKGLSEDQVDGVLAELQRALPEVAHRLLSGNDPFEKHFTTLNLR